MRNSIGFNLATSQGIRVKVGAKSPFFTEFWIGEIALFNWKAYFVSVGAVLLRGGLM